MLNMHEILLAIALAAAPAAQAHAQAPAQAQAQASPQAAEPEARPPDIVVEGKRAGDREISEFVNALARVPPGGQLAQFDAGVCPASLGLGQALDAAVAKRMRRVAAAAGIPLAREGCAPNVLVLVTDRKRETIEGLSKSHPALFAGLSEIRVRTLAKAPGPAAAWHLEGMLGSDGTQLFRDPQSGILSLNTTTPASRVKALSRPQFLGAVVMVELQALAGVTATQLADYAALRAFAETEPARAAKASMPSILTLIEDHAAGREPPLSLTQWDLSFLKSLYATSNAYQGNLQRGAMKQAFKKDLEAAGEARE